MSEEEFLEHAIQSLGLGHTIWVDIQDAPEPDGGMVISLLSRGREFKYTPSFSHLIGFQIEGSTIHKLVTRALEVYTREFLHEAAPSLMSVYGMMTDKNETIRLKWKWKEHREHTSEIRAAKQALRTPPSLEEKEFVNFIFRGARWPLRSLEIEGADMLVTYQAKALFMDIPIPVAITIPREMVTTQRRREATLMLNLEQETFFLGQLQKLIAEQNSRIRELSFKLKQAGVTDVEAE